MERETLHPTFLIMHLVLHLKLKLNCSFPKMLAI